MNDELKRSKEICEQLLKKNKAHEVKVESLTKDLARFTNGKETLDVILGTQWLSNEKFGIAYDGFMKYEKYKNYFVKASSSSQPSITCFYCNHKGHMINSCPIKKGTFKAKKVWVPKGPLPNITNTQGLKVA